MAEFFFGVPASTDQLWCQEMASVAPYCTGRGLDPGAGGRTFAAELLRLDCRRERQPHVCADAGRLPFADATFDFVLTAHLLEHLADPIATLREWLRVVRPGGHVITILPDVRFTHGQNTDPTPHLHEWSPRAFLRELFGWDDAALPWYQARPVAPWAVAHVVHMDEAAAGWSFGCVLRKTA